MQRGHFQRVTSRILVYPGIPSYVITRQRDTLIQVRCCGQARIRGIIQKSPYTVQVIGHATEVTLARCNRSIYIHRCRSDPQLTYVAPVGSIECMLRRPAKKYQGRITCRGVNSSGSHPKFWFTLAYTRTLQRDIWALMRCGCKRRHTYSSGNAEVVIHGWSNWIRCESDSRPL